MPGVSVARLGTGGGEGIGPALQLGAIGLGIDPRELVWRVDEHDRRAAMGDLRVIAERLMKMLSLLTGVPAGPLGSAHAVPR